MESTTFPQAPAPVIGVQRRRALLVAVSALVVDATATARAVTQRKLCWQKMQEAMDRIAEGVTECVPGCDIDGTAMYMEISR